TMYYIRAIRFIEQPLFTRQLLELVDDDAYRRFQDELAGNPQKGPLVRGTGGLRKARMGFSGRGKSGGARVLYLWFPRLHTIIFYFLYTKGDLENIPRAQLRAIRHEVQRIKDSLGEAG